MRRVLVPLDGTELAARVLPDARRLAGRAGEIILIRAARLQTTPEGESSPDEVTSARTYLETVARRLKGEGIRVSTYPVVADDPAVAIDMESVDLHADMIVMATHGRDESGRIHEGSVAWRALMRSTVPVMLRHVELDEEIEEPDRRRILVPLDGSPLAEKALPLADALAHEWGGELHLAHVAQEDAHDEELPTMGKDLAGPIHRHLLRGAAVDELAGAVERWSITDIVMTSHGRTGVSTVRVGVVADALIHRLRCPIVVMPALMILAE